MLSLIIIVLVALALYAPVLLPAPDKIIYGGDLATQFYYWKGYLVENIKDGVLPFWNPYNFSGTPFLAHPASAFFYPATLLYLFLPLNLAFSWNYFLHAVLGSVGIYLLLRIYTDKIASIIGALAYLLSGYFATRVYAGHVDLFTTAVYIPWVFFAIKKTIIKESRKNVLLAVMSLTLMILAGYQAYVLFTVELIVAYLGFNILKELIIAKNKDWKKIKRSFLVVFFIFIISILVTSIQWLPTWQLTKSSIRGEGLPYDLASWGALPLSGLKLFFEPLNRIELNKITFNLGGGPLPNPFDHFVGRLPLFIILIFILLKILTIIVFKKWRRSFVVNSDFWFFLLFVIFSLLISFSNNINPNLHYILYKLIPFHKFIRIPLQYLITVVFLVPVMLGMIIDLIKNRWLQVILGILIVSELYLFSRQYIFLTEKRYDQKLLSILKEQKEEGRLLPHFRVVSPVLSVFDFNAVTKYKIPTTSGYDPVILRDYYRFIDLTNRSLVDSLRFYNVEISPISISPNLLHFLGIKYILTEDAGIELNNKTNLQYELLFGGQDYKLYKNKNDTTKYFFVDKALIFPTESGLEKAIVDGDFNFTRAAIFEEKDTDSQIRNVDDCKEETIGEVKLLSSSINNIILGISAKCDSILSTSEVYYPGWRAKIEGSQTPIFKSNVAFRSVYIPKGTHTVEFYYHPGIYYLGGGISVLGVVVFVFSLFSGKWLSRT